MPRIVPSAAVFEDEHRWSQVQTIQPSTVVQYLLNGHQEKILHPVAAFDSQKSTNICVVWAVFDAEDGLDLCALAQG